LYHRVKLILLHRIQQGAIRDHFGFNKKPAKAGFFVPRKMAVAILSPLGELPSLKMLFNNDIFRRQQKTR
jgi:hypothetical protein